MRQTKQGDEIGYHHLDVLTTAQRALLLEALSSIRVSKHENIAEIDALSNRLNNAKVRPNITVCIANGQFQCARGNPFPDLHL